jgi:hypothetical protein
MQKPLDINDIFKKDPVRSILFLLIEFGSTKEGLRPLHFRYALEKKYPPHDKKDIELQRNIQKMKEFFGERLEDLYNSLYITKDCINSKEHLSYYLNLLGPRHLKVMDKRGGGKQSRYYLKSDFLKEGIRLQNKLIMDSFPKTRIKKFTTLENKESLSKKQNHVIYGLSDEIYKKFYSEDRKLVEKNLYDIEKKIKEIEDINKKFLLDEVNKRLKKFYNQTKSDKIKSILHEKSSDFFNMFIQVYKNQKLSGRSEKRFWTDFFWLFKVSEDHALKSIGNTQLKETCKKFSENNFGQDYNLSWDEISEMIAWGWKNIDLYDLVLPANIAFSSFHGDTNYFNIDFKDYFAKR